MSAFWLAVLLLILILGTGFVLGRGPDLKRFARRLWWGISRTTRGVGGWAIATIAEKRPVFVLGLALWFYLKAVGLVVEVYFATQDVELKSILWPTTPMYDAYPRWPVVLSDAQRHLEK